MPNKTPALTKHIRHARLVKIVRRSYQEINKGSRLFNNTSGVAWQGNAVNGADQVILNHPRPITFGIPGNKDGSGGADLLGWTSRKFCFYDTAGADEYLSCDTVNPVKNCLDCAWGNSIPVMTGIECKSGKARLMKNQVIFKKILLGYGGIYKVARECSTCWEHWTPIYKAGRIIEWIPVKDCPECKGLGYGLEE